MGFLLKPLNADGSFEEALEISGSKGFWRIGRDVANAIRIDDPTVSSFHAELKYDGETLVVSDVESRHGTFVNGDKIGRHDLSEGDFIKIGKGKFLVEAGPEEEPEVDAFDYKQEAETLQAEVSTFMVTLDSERRERQSREDELQKKVEQLRLDLADRDSKLTLQLSDIASRETTISQHETSIAEWSTACDQLQSSYDENLKLLAEKDQELLTNKASLEEQEVRFSFLVEGLGKLASKVLEDWEPWLGEERSDPSSESEGEAAELVLQKMENAADSVRAELRKIEPVWKEFGDKFQGELKRRCEGLVEEIESLDQNSKEAKSELEILEDDLEEIRKQVSDEIRRAQGLSRVGNEIEIPERFEKMVLAKDHEQELFKSVIDFLEEFEKQIAKYHKSRSSSYRKVAVSMDGFRDRLVAILESNDVKAFTIEEGTLLTPKHRKTVSVVMPEGWGGKKFTGVRFQPGEVIKVVRSGYEMGGSEFSTTLRKVEVVIRSEGED